MEEYPKSVPVGETSAPGISGNPQGEQPIDGTLVGITRGWKEVGWKEPCSQANCPSLFYSSIHPALVLCQALNVHFLISHLILQSSEVLIITGPVLYEETKDRRWGSDLPKVTQLRSDTVPIQAEIVYLQYPGI